MEEGEQVADAMERSQRNIDKKITKLEYYTEPVDELIESNDYLEMEIAVKPGISRSAIKLRSFIPQLEGINLDSGVSLREVR